MKWLVVLLAYLLAGTAAAQPVDQPSFKERYLADLQKEGAAKHIAPEGWVVIDTGETLDLGAGEGPLYEVYHRSRPHTCIVAVHPKDPTLSAVLECFPRVVDQDS